MTTVAYGFDRKPLVLVEDDGSSFALWDDVDYVSKRGARWTIPAGFKTDFATIPAIVAWAVAKLGAYTLAAIVHDLFCVGLARWHRAIQALHPDAVRHAVTVTGRVRYGDEWVDVPTASAVDADRIFYEIARDHGVDPVTARLLWVGVRWGAAFSAHRREGWLSTAPAVLFWSLVFSPVLVPACLVVGVARSVLWVARKVRSWFP